MLSRVTVPLCCDGGGLYHIISCRVGSGSGRRTIVPMCWWRVVVPIVPCVGVGSSPRMLMWYLVPYHVLWCGVVWRGMACGGGAWTSWQHEGGVQDKTIHHHTKHHIVLDHMRQERHQHTTPHRTTLGAAIRRGETIQGCSMQCDVMWYVSSPLVPSHFVGCYAHSTTSTIPHVSYLV